MEPQQWKPLTQHYGVTVGATPILLDAIAPVPSEARGAILTIETNPIRVRTDGQDPTTEAGGGRIMERGEKTIYGYDNLKKIKMIRDGSNLDAMISVEYFG